MLPGAKELIHQGYLETIVRRVFKGENILTEVRKEANIESDATKSYFEIDIWIPELQLCFEFQDPYHYTATWNYHSSLSAIQERDYAKKSKLLSRGQTLLLVPCWWDGNEESLVAAIMFARPELTALLSAPSSSSPSPSPSESLPSPSTSPSIPISLNPPISFFKTPVISGIGELMLASFPPESFGITPGTSWWMGEKYDGIRACWNFLDTKLYSRFGNTIELPQSFTKSFVDLMLDCELWLGRHGYPDAQGLINSNVTSVNWASVRVVTFDVIPVLNSPFDDRYKQLIASIPYTHPFLIAASRVKCQTQKHMTGAIKDITLDGGEGVVLRRPRSLYVSGRSDHLFKIKAARGDSEALVIQSNSPTEINLLLPNGVSFQVPIQDSGGVIAKRGDVVSFNYQSFSRSGPVQPRLTRVRTDLHWRDVLREHASTSSNSPSSSTSSKPRVFSASSFHTLSPKPPLRSSPSLRPPSDSVPAPSTPAVRSTRVARSDAPEELASKPMEELPKKHNYWMVDNHRNVRVFFEKVAKHHGLDPLLPESWYSLPASSVIRMKGSGRVFKIFGSMKKALFHAFPEIGLSVTKFMQAPKFYWQDIANRRRFFENYAKEHKFDPLVPENWYPLSTDSIMKSKRGNTVVTLYNKSFISALIHLFPEIGLEKAKFAFLPQNFWTTANKRKLMENFAENRGFDPLISSNWYSVALDELLRFKKVRSVLALYRGGYVEALCHLFPEIGLNENEFVKPNSYWEYSRNRRRFFLDLAKQKDFDPYQPQNWYSLQRDTVLQIEGATTVASYYKGSFVQALVWLFPNVTFERSKFHFLV